MCGLAGVFLSRTTAGQCSADDAVRRMCDRMQARGPDALGYWRDSKADLSLGHRRLSIIDLESRANQPMLSDDHRFVIVFNGEIYNFLELRRGLEEAGDRFRTQSDTEVLLRLFARHGEGMLSQLRGMFALAIWDRVTRTVLLARDPYGIKPLYLGQSKNGWLFASQVKALLASGLISYDSDPEGQSGFWLLGSVPEPRTWFRDITAVPAGSWCRISEDGQLVGPHKYWDIGDSWRKAPECRMTAGDVQEVVRTAVSRSVQQHLVADVPLGIFLSGGIDSGSLAGLMEDSGARDVLGVTVAFREFHGQHEDEVPAAKEIAERFGIRHHVRVITQQEFNSDLPRILSAMDQPSIDGINTWYASKAVAELGLKVVISGIGGDELFYGYPSFQQLPALVSRRRRLARVPGALLVADLALRAFARYSGNSRWRWVTREARNLYGAYWLRRGLFTPDDPPALLEGDASFHGSRERDPAALLESVAGDLPADPMAAVGQLESMVYLRNQLLRDSDWASMDHSVELRTPLVDAWLLRDLMPVLRSFGRLKGKHLLAASPVMPLSQAITGRTKTGFGIPLDVWMNHDGDHLTDCSGVSASHQAGQSSRRWAAMVANAIYAR
uniref:asparagine synthase (glutamine-hydrolyzing) n=1 Tax=Nitrospira cf. moscoviensis SBR1015 TaxID=96242 RepID=UPI000B3BB183|nr:asparagine synthase (glutamine-hydrolyzing) [Nitrospira cf. moscoviensis SBR1015]